MRENGQIRFLYLGVALLFLVMVFTILVDQPSFPLPTVIIENAAPTPSSGSSSSQGQKPLYNGPVNLNTATKAELLSIPGIGDVTAQRIIDYRQKMGGFTSIEQLLEVERIGEKTLENLRPYLKLTEE